MVKINCRICETRLTNQFLDLGFSPLANSYVNKKNYFKEENYFPLKVFFCKKCKLVQLPEHEKPDKIFSNYDYLSSPSLSWLKHSEKYVKHISRKLGFLKKKIKVCEIASNDGYLLQYFDKKRFEILGIEPAKNIARIAIKKKIPTISKFFGVNLSKKIKKNKGSFDLIIGNNVFAHVPNIKDFTKGMETLLSSNGIITLEFPHILNLINQKQFDTIYHEHFSYLSIKTVNFLLKKFNLEIFDIEKLSTHGGSVRVYIKKIKNNKIKVKKIKIKKIITMENKYKIFSISTFEKLQKNINKIKEDFLNFLVLKKLENKKVAAYGAPAKGNTFLNFCLVDRNLIQYTVDKADTKVGKFLPGSKIPIFSPKKLIKSNPDYLIILPWNLKDEIIKQLKKMGVKTQFVVCIPKLKIIK